ncbi:MAG: cytidylate kinase-like family protein [Eubacteriales bacterium]|nr:cytidylate kinase-like family protein [Eubacteriales bacterium]
MKTIITIGRQFGSGGRVIGKALAEHYQIPYYDKDILTMAAKESGLCEELFESHDEKPTNSFLYSLVMDTYSLGYSTSAFTDMPINYKVFLAQFDAIKKIAAEGPCVIVGRCADYALTDFDNVVNVFIHADLDKRAEIIAHRYDLEVDKAKDKVLKMDKKRASYYNYYSNKKWGDAKGYDICINSVCVGIEGATNLIIDLVNAFEAERGKNVVAEIIQRKTEFAEKSGQEPKKEGNKE